MNKREIRAARVEAAETPIMLLLRSGRLHREKEIVGVVKVACRQETERRSEYARLFDVSGSRALLKCIDADVTLGEFVDPVRMVKPIPSLPCVTLLLLLTNTGLLTRTSVLLAPRADTICKGFSM